VTGTAIQKINNKYKFEKLKKGVAITVFKENYGKTQKIG